MSLGAVLSFIFTLGWVPMYVFRAEGLIEAFPQYTGAERFWVPCTPVILSVHMTAVCVLLHASPQVHTGAAALSLLVFAAAVAFWFWGRVQIGPLRVRRLPDEPPQRLRSDGAFAIVRHPLYLSYIIAAGAPLLVIPRPLLILSYAASVAALTLRARQEERRLHAQLGDAYAAYCHAVKRFVPFVW